MSNSKLPTTESECLDAFESAKQPGHTPIKAKSSAQRRKPKMRDSKPGDSLNHPNPQLSLNFPTYNLKK